MPPFNFFQNIGMELIYSFVIIVCSLMIYFGTKNLYELSAYRGIKYFRLTFLFFAFAYFFRSIIKFLLVFFNRRAVFDFSPMILGVFTLFIFMYFSSMAIFYLLYSIMLKKWNGSPKKEFLFHALAFIIAALTVASRRIEVHLGLNIFLLVFIAFIVYLSYRSMKDRKKGRELHVIYLLLFIFWVLNIIDILIPDFLQTFQLLIYLTSLAIFLFILYKVLRKSGPG